MILTRGSGKEARNGKKVVESRILHSANWRIWQMNFSNCWLVYLNLNHTEQWVRSFSKS